MKKLNTMIVGCGVLTLCASAALAQQFQDQTATLFPPSPVEYTNQVTAGDLDGDGDLDLVFATGGNATTPGVASQLRIYINRINEVPAMFVDESAARAAGALFLARGVELGDVDRDGDLDIAVAQDFNQRPQLLINTLGVFVNETLTRLPNISMSSSRGQFADVDNDRDLDLYFVDGGLTNRLGTGQGKLFLNDGTGVYIDATGTNMPVGTVLAPMDCIFADIDGDLDLDLRIGSRNNQSRIFKNNGAGVFTVSTSPSDNNCNSYDFGDIDNDGDLDLFGANASNTTGNAELLLRNGGTGTYASTTFPVNTTVDFDSKFFDYDNDGDLDVIVGAAGTTGSPERIYSNNGTGTFTLQAGLITAISDYTLDLKVADLNGDGRLDVVTAHGESGTFSNKIYINVSGPIDTVVPNIVRTEQIADTMNTVGPYRMRAVVYDGMSSDRGFHDKGVVLNYTVANGIATSAVLQVPMDWVGNAEWRGSIPGQPTGSVITYFVTATDFANNLGTGPNRVFNILHPPCPADVAPPPNGDDNVNVDDLLAVINGWGQTWATHSITVRDTEFAPRQVNAKSGDTVHFNWESGLHTATSGGSCTADGRFNTTISAGQPFWMYVIPTSFSGAIPYFCVPHCLKGMTGNITVVPFAADVTGNGVVNVDDLLGVINAWGPCP